MIILVKLWTAYSVAHIHLAVLARVYGVSAPWSYVLPVSLLGVVLGGVTTVFISTTPNWPIIPDISILVHEWAAGAAFSAFFVGLSLITNEMRWRDERETETKRQLVEAQLKALTAQIEPHFLINTLANLRVLIQTDQHSAGKMLDHLADFLQGALERSRKTYSTLERELQLVENYLAIMQIRLGHRLQFTTEIDASLKDVLVPPLLLQTLVENAVSHGIQPHDTSGSIDVRANQVDNRLVLEVLDDGIGIPRAGTWESGHGLTNTEERLNTLYGSTATLDLLPNHPRGALARIVIPIEAHQ